MVDRDERRYQVFVSSTFKDLEHERQKVLQAILEMQAFPAGMELFPSADDDQWAFIKREIESSDYYIVIVAGKYGSLAPDGTSFTEKEYDYAVEIGKPVMGFLFHDLDDLKGSLLEADGIKKQKLEEFRAKVAKGKLIKHYHNRDELKAQVFHALEHSFRLKPQIGWVRAKNARREDLEEIADLQKQVISLTAEITKLREATRDRGSLLEQGNDTVRWNIQLDWVSRTKPIIQMDEHTSVNLSTTWNELLLACFGNKESHRFLWDVHTALMKLIEEKISARLEKRLFVMDRNTLGSKINLLRRYHPDSSEEMEIMDTEVKVWAYTKVKSEDVARIATDIQLQFQALNYIDVELNNDQVRTWVLTKPTGLLHLALLLGRTRKHDGNLKPQEAPTTEPGSESQLPQPPEPDPLVEDHGS